MEKIERKDIEDIIALTPLQQGMLFHYLEEPQSDFYFEQFSLEILGPVDKEIFTGAWNFVIRNNEMLRALFRWEEPEHPLQVILKESPLQLRYHDFTTHRHPQQQWEKLKQKDRDRKFHLRDVPFRVTLCKTGENVFQMMISNHHIIYDGWSNGIILKEFFKAYSDITLGKPLKEPAKTRFKEFVRWSKSRDLEAEKRYWEQHLQDYDSFTPLLIKNKTPSQTRNHAVETYSWSSGKERKQQWEDFLKNRQLTLATLLYGAWGILLQKCNNCSEAVFGTTVSGRSVKLPGIEDMVGLFINTIPLRIQAVNHEKISKHLNRIEKLLHSRESFENTPLVEIKQYSSISGEQELFDTLLVLENYPLDSRLIPENCPLSIRSFDITEVAHYDLVLVVNVLSQLEMKVIYKNALYSQESISRLIDHFVTVIQFLVENFHETTAEIDITSAEDKQKLLWEFNATQKDYPADKSIQQLFIEQVRQTPERVAVIGKQEQAPDKEGDVTLTYEKLNEKSAQLARHLNRNGVGSDTLVAIMTTRSIEMMIGIMGILKAGGAYMPIDIEYPQERIEFMLKDSRAGILLCEQNQGQNLNEFCRVMEINVGINEPASTADTDYSPSIPISNPRSNLAYIIYTSGTTGYAKGVMVVHCNVTRLVMNTNFVPLNTETRILQTGAPVFDATTFEIWGALLHGGQLILVNNDIILDALRLGQALFKYKVNTLWLSSPLFNQLMQQDSNIFYPLGYLLVGGDVLSPHMINKVRAENKDLKVINGYGPTENTTFSTTYSIERDFTGSIPIGKPINNSIAFILDRDGRLQAIGVFGELVVGGDGVSRGYLNRPELTAQKFCLRRPKGSFRENRPLETRKSFLLSRLPVYRTGDLARWQPDGNIQFLGRQDHQVKIRGFRIELGEIEHRLKQCKGIKDAAAVIKEDESGDKYICAYVVADEDKIITGAGEQLTKTLPAYMIPKVMVRLENMPLTSSGKLDRRALPEPTDTPAEAYIPPETGIEKKLAGIWAQILARDNTHAVQMKIGRQHNFFDLGGHSLKATSLLTKIHKSFNVKISLKDIFTHPTLAELSQCIQETVEEQWTLIPPVEKKEYYPLSPVQKRLYFLQQTDPTGTAYNISSAWVLEGQPEKIGLEHLFQQLMRRHESLRTAIRIIEHEPVQKIHEQVEFAVESIDSQTRGTLPPLLYFTRYFDLTRAPLLRLGLEKLGDRTYLFMVDMHHIISDGVSTAILMKELVALSQEEKLPPLKIHYKDYSHWTESPKAKELIKKQGTFWEKQFLTDIPVLNLPLDKPRPIIQSYAGSVVRFNLDKQTTRQLKEFANQEDATLFMVLLSAYTVFLAKIANQEDIIVGTPVANRNREDLNSITGMFVNTLPLRNFPCSEISFSGILKEVKDRTLEAFTNQEYPFSLMVETQTTQHTPDRNPLFDTMFVLQNMERTVIDQPHMKLTPYEMEREISKFDLTLEAEEKEGHLYFNLEYCTKLFEKGTIERFGGFIRKIVAQLLENPQQRIADIELISKKEKKQILIEFNNNPIDYPRGKTIYELYAAQAAETPDNLAVVGWEIPVSKKDSIGNSEILSERRTKPGNKVPQEEPLLSLTYKELTLTARSLTRRLKEMGAGPETIVALKIHRSIEMVIAILAVLESGAAFLPIDPESPRERIEFMLKDSKAALLLTLKKKEGQRDRKETWQMKKMGEPGDRQNGSATLAYIIYTSGTTGKPKGVMVGHEGIANLKVFWAHEKGFGVNARDHVVQFANYTFDASITEFFMAFFCGAALYLVSKTIIQDYALMEDFLQTHSITVVTYPPPYLTHLDPEKVTTLRKLITAGSETNTELLNRWKDRGDYINAYGPTEVTICATSWQAMDTPLPYLSPAVPIGTPIFNTRIFILNPNFQVQPLGIAGELFVDGVGITRGYMNRPELTSEKFCRRRPKGSFRENRPLETRKSFLLTQPPIYRTGDLARWKPEGNIEFLGRADHQVKIRGYRVELSEIQQVLQEQPEINQALVVAVDDKGEKEHELCAYYVSESELSLSMLRNNLAKSLPVYMIPAYFVRIEQIPLTPNGKIDRKALPQPIIKSETPYTPPRDKLETRLTEIWAQVLQIDKPVGIDDDFFHLGGHSLKATALTSRIHKILEIKIPLREILKEPTIRGLSRYIKTAGHDPFKALEPVEKREYYPLSSPQKRLHLLQQMDKPGITYNMPSVWILEGVLSKDRLENIFQKLVQRHESLRTTFRVLNEEPVQQIQDNVMFRIIHEKVSVEGAVSAPSTSEILSKTIEKFIRPFDLTKPPLLRVGLIVLSHEKHLLMMDMHHIIGDGISMKVLVQEFAALYDGAQLPVIKLHYKDYAGWQLKHTGKGTSETYWLNRFKAGVPVLEMPLDNPRPRHRDFSGKRICCTLPGKQSQQLKILAKEVGTTLYTVLLTFFNVLLSKLTGQEEILVGTVTANRPHANLERIMGMFVNTLALINSLKENISFRTFLQQVKVSTWEAFENQDYPFEELVEKLPLNRDTGRNPLIDVMFDMQPVSRSDVTIPSLKIIPYDYHSGTAKFDLLLQALEEKEKLELIFEYSTQLFNESTIERYSQCYLKVIQSVLENLEISLAEIEIISESEKQQVLWEFNRTAAEYPAQESIHRLFEKEAVREPGRAAVVFQEQTLTYAELNRQTTQLAAYLQAKGVEPEVPVAIMSEASLQMIIAVLAILKAGGVYMPIDPGYPRNRIDYMLADSSTRWLITTDKNNRDEENKLHNNWGQVEQIRLDSGERIVNGIDMETLPLGKPPVRSESLAYIMYTSGSTGRPKGVMVTHRNVTRLVKNTNYITFNPGDRILQTGALEFDASTFEIWGALLNGLTLYLAPKNQLLQPVAIKEKIRNYNITVMWMTAPLFNQMVGSDEDIFAGLRYLLVGGDILSPPHINRIRNKYPALAIINGYGPTENTTFSTTFLIDKDYEDNIPIGKPIANSIAYILDINGFLQPIGISGELWLGGDGVSRGYLNRPELTSNKYRNLFRTYKKFFRGSRGAILQKSPLAVGDKLYCTGDLARWQPDGNIQFLGRVDNQVKIRGFRIEPGEIENHLKNHPCIREAVVAIKKDTGGDKYLSSYMVISGDLQEPEIKEFLAGKLPPYMLPSSFVIMEEIPLTANGKVDWRALPEPGIGEIQEYTPPRDQVEKKLVEIWSQVLGEEEKSIGIDIDFFHLGGHSLKAALLTARIHKAFEVNISLVEIFSKPTIRQLATYIKQATRDKYRALRPVEIKEYYTISPAQKRIFLLQQMDETGTVYNIPSVWQLRGKVDTEKLAEIFRQLVRRHESFRTSFHLLNRQPVQRIHDGVKFEISSEKVAVEGAVSAPLTSNLLIDRIEKFIRPFDLTQAPLLRTALILCNVEPGIETTLLVLDMHHIISDGQSVQRYTKEFMALYTGETLPHLKIQYKDYAVTWTQRQQQEAVQKQEMFWAKQLEGEIPILNLYTDNPRPAVQRYEGQVIPFTLESTRLHALKEIARKQETTLFMLLLAIFNVFLAKLSGQEDIVVGTPIAGRNHADLEPIIGMFVNTLALRNFPCAEKTFPEILNEVKTGTLQAYANQDYPFEELVEKVKAPRNAGRNPLFDVMFMFQEMEAAPEEIVKKENSNFFIETFPLKHQTVKFDITLTAEEKADEITFSLAYSTILFEERTITRWIEFFKKIVTQVMETPGIKISQIHIIDLQEKKRILQEFNAAESFNIHSKGPATMEIFAEQAEKIPHHIALSGSHGTGETFVHTSSPAYISYWALRERVYHLAQLLKKKKTGSETIVGIMMPRTLEMVIAVMAVLQAGGAYLPLDPGNPQERIKYILADSKARLLLVNEKSQEIGKFLQAEHGELEIINIDDHLNPEPAPPQNPVPLTSSAYIIYTSGSTGQPKGVLVEHRAILNTLMVLANRYPCTDGDNYLLKTSFLFDVSLTELLGWYIKGGTLSVLEAGAEKEPLKIIDAIERKRITHINFVPSMFNVFIETLKEVDNRALSSLKYVFLAGEALWPGLVSQGKALLQGVVLENLYGPTEAAVYASGYSLQQWQGQGRIPIGKPLNRVMLLILDRAYWIQPVGIPGELAISGAGLARGYLNRPELTSMKFCLRRPKGSFRENRPLETRKSFLLNRPLIYRTGDLARWYPDGNVEFLGRIDYQVKIRGYRIELGEIETHLANRDDIKEAVVLIKQGSDGDNYLCAYITVPGQISIEGVKESLSARLPEYMIPAHFVILEEMPLTPTGKVNRKVLPEPEYASTARYTAPRDRVEERLAEIWEEFVGTAQSPEQTNTIGIDDNFFHLGGHSLKAALLATRIHKEFQSHITLAEIFSRPTIRKQASFIKEAAKETDIRLEPTEIKEYYPLSPAQKRMYLLQQMEKEGTVYNIPSVWILEGPIDRKKLDSIFKQLVQRHESFRTSFHLVNREPVQRIHGGVKFEISSEKVAGNGAVSAPLTSNLLTGRIEKFIRPFDLTRAPLLRVEVQALEENRQILLIDMHHIISDRLSIERLIEEMSVLYAGKELKPLNIQYKDYSEAWKQRRHQDIYRKQEDFWLDCFKGEIPVLNLQTDFPRPTVQSFAGQEVHFSLETKESKILKNLARKHNTTLFMALLTIYNILLAKLSGQEDVIVGTPTAGRNHADLEPIIGMFVSTLAIRNYPSPHKTFIEVLEEIREQTLRSLDNQEYPFEDLVEKVEIPRDTGRSPLFDVMFTLLNPEADEINIPGLSLRPVQYKRETAKFDLVLQAVEKENYLSFSFEYCTSLFEEETIQRYTRYFKKIASEVVENPGIRVSKIELMSEEEKNRVLLHFNDTKTAYPWEKSLQQLFAEEVEKQPDKVALAVEGRNLSYRLLNQISSRLALYLHELGVKPGMPVGIMLKASIEMIAGLLAILKAGGGYLPIDPGYPEERKRFIQADSNIKVLIDQNILKASQKKNIKNTNEQTVPDTHLAYIIYTSGSTGKPKGVIVEHQNVVRLVKNSNFIDMQKDERVLQTGALEFDASTFEIWWALLNGLTLYLASKNRLLNPATLKQIMENHHITTIWMTTPLFNQMVQLDEEIFAGLRNLLVGGDVLSPPHINRIRRRYPHIRIINGYGPTENTTFSTTFSIDREYSESIPIGKPIANSTAYIVTVDGKPQPIGIAGELWVGGDGVSRGYMNNPELTFEKFIHWQPGNSYNRMRGKILLSEQSTTHLYDRSSVYKTGDLACWQRDGNIRFLGRIDQQVKIRGYRIEPQEIEIRLLDHHQIREAVVLPVKGKNNEKYLCAYLVTEKELEPSEIKHFLSADIPDFMIPSYFVNLDQIPITPNGKVDRKSLSGIRTTVKTEIIHPRNETEEKIARIWTEVLETPVSIYDNFFEIGGHSLKATIIISRIYKGLGYEVPQSQLFKTPTIAGLSEFIADNYDMKEIQGYLSIQPEEQREYYAATSSQQRFYILHQMSPESIVNNIPLVIQPKEVIDSDKLEKALRKLMKRHEALRTSFHMVKDQVVQRVRKEVDFKLEYRDLQKEKNRQVEDNDTQLPALIKEFLRPFDMSDAPLMRSGLIRVNNRKDLLIIDMHHIVSDGTSVQILGREIMALYQGKDLAPQRIHYKDFSQWQQRLFLSGKMKTHEEFWLQQLKGPLPELTLPADKPEPETQSYAGQTYRINLTENLTRQLNKLGSSTETTLYMLLLAVFNILLYKYTGLKDIIVGSPIARRDHVDLENIIGLIMESIVIRNRFHENQTFLEFLGQVKNKTLAAYEHQVYPHDELLKKLDKRSESFHHAVTNVALIVQNMTDHNLKSYLNAETNTLYSPETSKLDLTIIAWEMKNSENPGILLEFEYSTQLFSEETIHRLAGHFINILETVVKKPEIDLPEILLLSRQEIRELTGIDTSCYHLSHAQKRIYYMEKTFPGTSVGTLAFTVRYPREVKKDRLEKAIGQILQRHDGLRLHMVETPFDPQPLQYIAPYRPYTLPEMDFRGPDSEKRLQQWLQQDTRKPFQFFKSQLFYFAYVRFNEKESGYYLKVHHIIADGWAVYMLFDEINRYCETLESDETPAIDLSTAPSYIDYLQDERDYLKSVPAGQDREFWHRSLNPLPEEVRLSTKEFNYANIKGHVHKFSMPAPLRALIEDYCSEQKTSVYKVLCSALAIYIFRTTGIEDMVIGSASHNRTTKEQKQMTGMFVSTIPIRIQTSPLMGFQELVRETGKRINTVIKNHQRYPFDVLMEEIRQETGIDPNYLLNINLIGHGNLREGAFEIQHHFAGNDPTHITIHVNNKVDREILELEWVVQEELFTGEQVARIHQGIVNILASSMENPTRKLSEIELLSLEEKDRLLREWNNTHSSYTREHVNRRFGAQVRKSPDKIAVSAADLKYGDAKKINTQPETAADKIDEFGTITYRELEHRSNKLAARLQKQGVGHDTIVGIKVQPSLQMVIGLWAILKAGGAYLPLDHGYPQDRIDYMLADSGANILLNREGKNNNVRTGIKIIDIDAAKPDAVTVVDNPVEQPVNQPSQQSLAYIIYTSGTTGRPKGVAIEHRNLSAYLHAFDCEFSINSQDVVIQQASFAFDAFVEEFYPVLLGGGKLAIPRREQILAIDLLCRFIQRHRISMITCSPLLLNELNKKENQPLLQTIRIFISGGDRLNKAYIEHLLKPEGVVVYNTYGPTETTVCATYYRCGTHSPSLVPIGKPINNYRVYVLDRYDNLLPIGVSGELAVSGEGVTRGYLNRPELTSKKFCLRRPKGSFRENRPLETRKSFLLGRLSIYRTGDLARWQPDGNVEFLGRIDHQVKIRGYRIELQEIENQLLRHQHLKDVAVLVEGEDHDKFLCAYIVPQAGSTPDKSGIREYLIQKVPVYMVPEQFIQVDRIPMTPQGKVDRKKLKSLQGNALKLKGTYVAPHSELEKTVAAAWKEILGLEKIGLYDNFFELGGNSIKVTQLNAKLKKILAREIPMVDMFKYETIQSFTQYLTQEKTGEPTVLEKETAARSSLAEKAKDRRKLQKNKRRRGN